MVPAGLVLLHFFSRKWRQYMVRFSCCTSSGMAWSVLWWRAWTDSLSSPVSICACLRCSPPPPPFVGIVLLIVFRKRRKLEGCGYGRPAAVVVAEYDAAVKAEAEKAGRTGKEGSGHPLRPRGGAEKNAAEADEESGSEENAEEPSAGKKTFLAASGEAREAAPAETDESGPEA